MTVALVAGATRGSERVTVAGGTVIAVPSTTSSRSRSPISEMMLEHYGVREVRVDVERCAGPGVRLHRRRRHRPDAWRYIVEHRERGLPADDTGYR